MKKRPIEAKETYWNWHRHTHTHTPDVDASFDCQAHREEDEDDGEEGACSGYQVQRFYCQLQVRTLKQGEVALPRMPVLVSLFYS